jgi:hypothetical protein
MRRSLWPLALPALAWAATAVTFDPDQSLSGIGDTTDPDIREVGLAANPADPSQLAAVFVDDFPRSRSMNCRAVTSTDGGITWSPGDAMPLQRGRRRRCADPSVALDAQGNAYAAYLDLATLGAGTSDILVARSADGGRTWGAPVVIARSDADVEVFDKPYLALDTRPDSPFRGTIYVGYTRLGAADDTILVAVSRDGGAAWSAPVTVSRAAPFPTDEVDGALPVIAPDGAAHVFFADFKTGTGPTQIRFASSRDGGQTWSPPADAVAGLPSPGLFLVKNADPDFGTGPNVGLLGNSFPAAAVAGDGTIYLAWADFPQGACSSIPGSRPVCVDADVRLSVSRDDGGTWSAPVKVSDEIGPSDQFLPWIAAHPDGLLSLIWLDRRLDPDNVNYDVFYTNSADGLVFLPDLRISSASSLPGTRFYIGSYPGLAALPGAVVAAWPDLRSTDSPEVFAARGALGP